MEKYEIQGTTVKVDSEDAYWRENSNSTKRSRFLPMKVNGEEIEAPIENIDVLDLPGGIDAQFIAVFEGDIVIAYEDTENQINSLRYNPNSLDKWKAEPLSRDENPAEWEEIISEKDKIWERNEGEE